MKEVTLKVNGNLYVGNLLPECNGRACVRELKCVEGRTKMKEIILDKDMEFSGDVFVDDIIIPDGVSANILCAGGLGCGYKLM